MTRIVEVHDNFAEVKRVRGIVGDELTPVDEMLLGKGGGVARTPTQYRTISTGWDISPLGEPPHQTTIRTWRGERVFLAETSGTPVIVKRRSHHLAVYGDWAQLLVPFEGSLEFEQANRHHRVVPGNIGCLSHSAGYEFTSEPGSRFAIMYVPGSSLLRHGFSTEDVASRSWAGGPLIPTLSVLIRELLEHSDLAPSWRLETVLLEVAVNVLAAVPKSGGGTTADERLRSELLELIDATFHDQDLTVDTLARELSVSRRYLYDVLEPTGKSVGALLRARRVNHGSQLLQTRPDLSLRHVAGLCGFRGPDQFSRSFKARFGVTPSEFRSMTKPSD